MKIVLLILSFSIIGVGSAFAQGFHEVKKVCYGPSNSAMVVEVDNLYYVITSDRIPLTGNMMIADIPSIHFGGQSQMRFFTGTGSVRFDYVNVIKPGQPVNINNRWQRFLYSGLPGARSVCRQIAYGY